MDNIKSYEIEEKFESFFLSKKHSSLPGSSLLPENKDSGVLFNIAGMQPLIEYFNGKKHPLGKKLTNTQKCLRTNDIDEVGDNSHLTFFEMLGNWSLNDYFKKDSITWSWEFLTSKEWLGIEKELLSVTVFEGDSNAPIDNESSEIWKSLGLNENKIAYLGVEDNWWSAGETGPCGPDTEIFYRVGDEKYPPEWSNVKNDEDNWMEIWNNVFIQFNKNTDGRLDKLETQNVDTGMGLERITTALNGKKSVYETDLFVDVITKIKDIIKPDEDENERSIRIIADHTRAAVNLIADGVYPKNIEQGYILRRLIRRAIREAYKMKYEGPLLEIIGKIFIEKFKHKYDSVNNNQDKIITELNKEEDKFSKTLKRGLKEFDKIISKKGEDNIINGQEAFKLFDTFGFPIEITCEVASEKGYNVDLEGFNIAFKKHQELSRGNIKKGQNKGGIEKKGTKTPHLHTATHLLLAGLRDVLGDHIHQAGSHITDERLRFDFTHNEKLAKEEIERVQEYVNQAIKSKLNISKYTISKQEAQEKGIEGSFWDKYPDNVTVYKMVGEDGKIYSEELCGGPHLKSSIPMGEFKITKEESSGAGVRRIKAVLEKK